MDLREVTPIALVLDIFLDKTRRSEGGGRAFISGVPLSCLGAGVGLVTALGVSVAASISRCACSSSVGGSKS